MVLMSCNDPGLSAILSIVKNILNIIWIIGPIIAMIALIIAITSMINNPDDKKIPNKIKNSIIALVVLFLIPAIINATMYMIGESSKISACWNSASGKINSRSNYIDPHTGKKKGVIINPGDYEKGDAKKEDYGSGQYTGYDGAPVTACGSLEYCNKFLTIMYNNSNRLNETMVRTGAPSEYSWPKAAKSWGAALSLAEQGKLVATTCVVPASWGMTDVVGKHTVLNSVGPGGFHGYKGPITQYTKQLTFDGSMTVKEAIQKGMILPGDIIGVKGHTFAIYSVNRSEGSAVVFDGGHRFTNKCQKQRKCSPMFTYSAGSNKSMRLLQIVRWVK